MIKSALKKTLIYMLVLLTAQGAFAQTRSAVSDLSARSIAEYFYSRTGNEILTPIRILGGVQLPGIYHVPRETELATLIALSGGALNDADITKMKYTPRGQKTQEINLYDYIGKGQDIKLSGGEILYVPKKEGWISNEAATTLTILLSVISVGLTAYVVSRTVD